MYQKINLADHSLIGKPGPVPPSLAGLSDAQLADLDAFSDPAPAGLDGLGFWPVTVLPPSPFNPSSQVAIPPASYTADATTRTVTGQAAARAMTADEFAAANPVPDSVTNYQARTALRALPGPGGKNMRDVIDAALRGADQTVSANAEALEAWDYANSFFRDQTFVVALGPTFGLQPSDIDDLFRAAAKVG